MAKEMTGKEANGQAFLRQAKSLYYARESALFSPTPRESRKREAWTLEKRKEKREKEGEKRKEMREECHSRSRSLDGTSRVLMGIGELKNEQKTGWQK